MSRVAARYQIVTPFHGYVDPFALSTPAPTPPPPPAQKALLTGGGLHKLEVTSNDATAMVIAIEFALPPIASVNWDVPAYTIELSVPGQAVHAQIVVDAVVKPAAGGAPSVVALTATITVRDYSAAARTINAILAQEMYTLSVRGTGAPNDVIGQFLSKLEPIVVSRPPATQDPSATTIGGGVDTMMSAMAASGFKITGASSTGLDVTGRWAVVEALFAVGINATINVNLTPPPQISILHVRPATRGGGEAKLLDVELRSVTGTLDAYTAAAAVTANNRNVDRPGDQHAAEAADGRAGAAGTSTGTSLFARLLANVRHRVVIQPPAPAMVAGMMTQAQAVLLGMRYKSSGPDSVTIGINFNATLPIQAVVDVGNLHVDVVHQNTPILTVDAAQFKLVPDVNQFALEATINGFNRAALEDAVGRAVFCRRPTSRRSSSCSAARSARPSGARAAPFRSSCSLTCRRARIRPKWARTRTSRSSAPSSSRCASARRRARCRHRVPQPRAAARTAACRHGARRPARLVLARHRPRPLPRQSDHARHSRRHRQAQDHV
jgi:hypothetical protein